MKKIIFSMIILAAALCACTKKVEVLETLVFTATVEGAPESKAAFNSEYKCAAWEVGDLIDINGKLYSAQEAGTTTTFKAAFEGSEAEGPAYKAYFPASLYDGTTATLPAVQTYTAGKFDMPMYASSTTAKLEFKNLCAVLAIKVTSEDITRLKSIKVMSDRQMNGTFTVSEDGKAVIGEDGPNVVELVCPEVLELDITGTTFYIAIPAQIYRYLNIFLSSDGTTYTQAMATKKADGLGEIARSKMFSIEYAENAAKLWESNLFVANCNVGAKSATEYGGHYSWGGKTDGSGSDYYPGPEMALPREYDTATNLWGSNWRMLTSSEIEDLLNNCSARWTENYNGTAVNGLLCSSKIYNGNSVFLPATELEPPVGLYWTSSGWNEGYSSLALYFDKNNGVINPRKARRPVPHPVRAVLDPHSDIREQGSGGTLDLYDGGNTDPWF